MTPRLSLLALCLLPTLAHAQQRPKVVLVGDSIRIGYAPLVEKHLDGKAEIITPGKVAGDSAWLLKNLDNFVLEHKPDLVHFNVGLDELKHSRKEQTYQVNIETYEKNLDAILAQLKETKVTIVFATTTPIDDERHAKRKGGFDRFEKDVKRYNEVALKLARKH